MGLSDIFKNLLKKGFKIGYSTGKPFDPSTQIRTDAMEDIAKKKEERDGNTAKNLR